MSLHEQAIVQLYRAIRGTDELEELVENALEIGARQLNVDNGHLTWIDPVHDHWEALVSTDPPTSDLPAGMTLALEKTYCRLVIDEDGPLVIDDAPNQGWREDPAYESHQLDCYFGTPIQIDDTLFGTVCFVANEARTEPFSAAETVFGELIARVLEHELRQRQAELHLEQRRQLTGVLSRVLRHNMRNDMTVIQGYTDMVRGRIEDDGLADQLAIIETRVDRLIELGEKARELESIAEADDTIRQVDIPLLIDEVIESVNQGQPTGTITRAGIDSVSVPAMPSLRRAFRELIENAVKHGPADGAVEVTVEGRPAGVNVHIEDEGEGLPDQERAAFEMGGETPLSHGSGLGLQIVDWIVSGHGGTVTIEEGEAGTRVSVHLPDNPRQIDLR